MIELEDLNGHKIFISPQAVAQVQETGASSQWHGIKAIVRTFDGRVLEVRNAAADVARDVRQGQML